MANAKHTPGPWHVETPMDECFSIVDDAKQVYDWKMVANVTWDHKDEREPGCPFITKREAEANARLIAAAPDLLTALQMALPALEWCDKQWAATPQHGDGVNVLTVARAAIARATHPAA